MKNIVFIPINYDLNRGDQALMWESIRLAQDVYHEESINCVIMSSLHDKDSVAQNRQTRDLGYDFITTILDHPGRKFKHKTSDSKAYSRQTLIGWGLQAICDYLTTRPLLSRFSLIRRLGVLLLNKEKKQSYNFIKDSDAVFLKGGGFIHSFGAMTDPYFMYFSTFHIRLATALGKPTFVLPNSIGPLNNSIAKKIAIKTLCNSTLVSVREIITKNYLDSLKVPCEYYPDLGFYLRPSSKSFEDYLRERGVPISDKKVVMTLRPYRFQGHSNSEELFQQYLQGVTGLVEYVISRGYHVTFMAHTLGPSSHEDDRIALKDLISQLKPEFKEKTSYIEDFELTCRDIEKIYSYFDYMVGTRFHSVIFSLNVDVPAIAIAYGGNKGKGIMNVLGNDDYSIDIDKIRADSLITMFKNLETNRDAYLDNLRKRKEHLSEKRNNLIMRIRELLFM